MLSYHIAFGLRSLSLKRHDTILNAHIYKALLTPCIILVAHFGAAAR